MVFRQDNADRDVVILSADAIVEGAQEDIRVKGVAHENHVLGRDFPMVVSVLDEILDGSVRVVDGADRMPR